MVSGSASKHNLSIGCVLQNLTNALTASTAKRKIVSWHHTMRSLGTHGDTLELLQAVLPILDV